MIRDELDKIFKDNHILNDNHILTINRNDIKKLIYGIRNVIMPGFYQGDDTVESIYEHLSVMISKIYEYMNIDDDFRAKAYEFMKELPHVTKMLLYDLEAFYNGDPAAKSKEEIIIAYPGFYAIYIYRIAHILYRLEIPLLPRMLSEMAHADTGVDINPGAVIGHSFFIDHATGVVIGETTNIGNNVKIYQGVTLGALSIKDGNSVRGIKRHPTIEDNVTIYSGASILGGDVTIGHDSIIGGNAFITESIPPYSLVKIKKYDIEIKQRHQD